MPGPLLPAQAQMQLELCRQLQQGTPAAVCVPSWHQVFTMWSRGTDMVQADTPAFGVHLWTRVQPMVRFEHQFQYIYFVQTAYLILWNASADMLKA